MSVCIYIYMHIKLNILGQAKQKYSLGTKNEYSIYFKSD